MPQSKLEVMWGGGVSKGKRASKMLKETWGQRNGVYFATRAFAMPNMAPGREQALIADTQKGVTPKH